MQQHNYSSKPFQMKINQFNVSGELILPLGESTFPLIIYVWGSGPTNYKKTKSSNTFKLFLESGYALLLYDKPGSGKSTGKFTPKKLITERTLIAGKIIEKVSQNQQIDSNKIGLFGSSQAGYIIPSIIKTTPMVSFAISWSTPMENGVPQSAYQVKEFLICEGYSPIQASKAEKMYIEREMAQTYNEYLLPATYLNNIDPVRDVLGWGDILAESSFKPISVDSDDLIDPKEMLLDVNIPYLALYGENDKNINPIQAIDAFKEIINDRAKDNFFVHLIPDADHNMVITETGCIQDQLNGYLGLDEVRISEIFYENIKSFLNHIHPQSSDKF